MRSHEEFKEELLRRKSAAIQRRNRVLTRSLCAAVCLCLIFTFAMQPATVNAEDLLADYSPNTVPSKAPDETFTAAYLEFSLNLLQYGYDGSNTLLSPLSATQALSLLANGAGGETLAQIQEALYGNISVDAWNAYLKYYVNSLPSTRKARLLQANSVWYDQNANLSLHPAFLQTVTDYYNAELYSAPFNSHTVNEINKWISNNTDGLIDQAVNDLDDVVMCLINALVFDGKWAEPYEDSDIRDREFHNADGSSQIVDMMYSTENLYLESDTARGFMKQYDGGSYAFVAILPNEDLTLTEYLESLTAKGLMQLLNSVQDTDVDAGLPQFEYGFSIELNHVLQKMGMTDAFDPASADFSGMGGNLYVGTVLHKTHITVDAHGTKAASITIGGLEPTSAPAPNKTVILDRPFLYMIVDTQSNLPVFIGTVTNFDD